MHWRGHIWTRLNGVDIEVCVVPQDADDLGSDSAAEAGFSGGNDVAAVSFSELYEALGSSLNNERTALLLYDALHACLNFQNYVLVRRCRLILLVMP